MLPTPVSIQKIPFHAPGLLQNNIVDKKSDSYKLENLSDLKDFLVGKLGSQCGMTHLAKIINSVEYCCTQMPQNRHVGQLFSSIQPRVLSSIKNHIRSLLKENSPFSEIERMDFALDKAFSALQGILEKDAYFEERDYFHYSSSAQYKMNSLNAFRQKLGLSLGSDEIYSYFLLNFDEFTPELFKYAALSHADFADANLEGCDLSHCDLRNAKLRHADLDSCIMKETLLEGADLNNQQLVHALWSGADFGADRYNVIDRIIGSIYDGSDSELQLKLFDSTSSENTSLLAHIESYPSEHRFPVFEMLCSRLLRVGFVPQCQQVLSSLQNALHRMELEPLMNNSAVQEFMKYLDSIPPFHVVIDIPEEMVVPVYDIENQVG